MVERRTELDRRYRRKKKMKKLKAKLTAGGGDREVILAKIKRLSPFWTEAALRAANAPQAAAPKDEAPKEPKKKAPPKPKAEKKPPAAPPQS